MKHPWALDFNIIITSSPPHLRVWSGIPSCNIRCYWENMAHWNGDLPIVGPPFTTFGHCKPANLTFNLPFNHSPCKFTAVPSRTKIDIQLAREFADVGIYLASQFDLFVPNSRRVSKSSYIYVKCNLIFPDSYVFQRNFRSEITSFCRIAMVIQLSNFTDKHHIIILSYLYITLCVIKH